MTSRVLPLDPAAAPPDAADPVPVPAGEAGIYDAIFEAIAERRLPPGTRLVEEHLGEIFGVSRARIRKVLGQLAHTGVVTLERNRGAIVARPTPAEARQVFEARRLIEQGIAQALAAGQGARAARRLRRHVAQEIEAHHRGDRPAAIRLSGEFHLLLAELHGNPVLSDFLRALISRSSLIIAVYQSPSAPDCSHADHEALIAAIESGDGPAAAESMAQHLQRLVDGLDLGATEAAQPDLRRIFAAVPGATTRRG